MQTTPNKSSIQTQNLLVCFTDIENFLSITKKLKLEVLVGFMQSLTCITTDIVHEAEGMVVKYIGDSILITFPEEKIDQGVTALLKLKAELEEYIKEAGFSNRISFSLHYGPVASGHLGKEPFCFFDVYGEAVNVAALNLRNPFKGRLNITPQLFRKLNSQTRKLFHKYTPPIVYIAE